MRMPVFRFALLLPLLFGAATFANAQ